MTISKWHRLNMMPKGEFEAGLAELERGLICVQMDPIEVFDRFRTDPEYARRVAYLMAQEYGQKAFTSPERAFMIMGDNFFGVKEIMDYFGINIGKNRSLFDIVPYSERMLSESKDTHVLVAVHPLSIIDMRSRVDRALFFGQEKANYNREKFANVHGTASWQLIRKEPIMGSLGRKRNQQCNLLLPGESVPTARALAYTIIGHFLATGERLFETVLVRSSDINDRGFCMCIGTFGDKGLIITDFLDKNTRPYLGLAGGIIHSI